VELLYVIGKRVELQEPGVKTSFVWTLEHLEIVKFFAEMLTDKYYA